MIALGRAVCGDLSQAERREWLVTNGIGGFACGTVAGTLTRVYHGLLIAATTPPLGRRLKVAKLDARASYRDEDFDLATNRWADGTIAPDGTRFLERFELRAGLPVWTFAFADAIVEQTIWMEHGANTTYVQWNVRVASAPVAFSWKALVDDRDMHAVTQNAAEPPSLPFITSDRARASAENVWYRNVDLARERERGLLDREDLYFAQRWTATLQPGETVTFTLADRPLPERIDVVAAAERRAKRDAALREAAPHVDPDLARAADAFIVARTRPDGGRGTSMTAGYPWFGDWGRDTMIALPGLLLATNRPADARDVLETFAGALDGGMLPNAYPEAGTAPSYNTVDAALWYAHAADAYVRLTDDRSAIPFLAAAVVAISDGYARGTRYGIGVDPHDGLLHAGVPGVQLTWMDAKVGDHVITPRIGKPVEINALWIVANRIAARLASLAGDDPERFHRRADAALASFAPRFWNPRREALFDVVDGPNGDDDALRPNQIFAVSLAPDLLDAPKRTAIVRICAATLLTSLGLRSLAPGEPGYNGTYAGDVVARDGAYHEGTVWPWLIGAFIEAFLATGGTRDAAAAYLAPLRDHLADACLGSISEIADGDAPFLPRGAFAQAWSVAELIRALNLVATP